MTHIAEQQTDVSLYEQLEISDLLAVRAINLLEYAVMNNSQHIFDSLADSPARNTTFKVTDGKRTLQITIAIEEIE